MADPTKWPNPKSWHGLSPNQKAWGREQSRLASIYADPIIMSCRQDQSVFTTATGFLFKPGKKTFLVTNAHVLDDAYLAIKEKYGSAEFQFGDRVFEPNVIAKDANPYVDLAVIDVDGIEFPKRDRGYWGSDMGALAPYTPSQWPLEPAKEGEVTVTARWPAKFRVKEADALEFAYFGMFGQRIGDVDDRRFIIPFDREYWTSSDFDPTNPIIFEKELGGLSGGPVFTMHRPGIQTLQLVGVVQRYGETLDVLRCARADVIQADGSLSTLAG